MTDRTEEIKSLTLEVETLEERIAPGGIGIGAGVEIGIGIEVGGGEEEHCE
jgi:hypothetical protein